MADSLRTDVRALVVGGGAVGAGIAYALAHAGWEPLLLERDELTAGSTWHAAGLLPLFNMGYATTHIHKHSVDLYKRLEAETGLNPGFLRRGQPAHGAHARAHGRVRTVQHAAETAGVEHEFLTPKEIADRWPLVRSDDSWGAAAPPGRLHQPRRRDHGAGQGGRQKGAPSKRRWQVDGFTSARRTAGR
jgi:dimethylglycine dehydrogenase